MTGTLSGNDEMLNQTTTQLTGPLTDPLTGPLTGPPPCQVESDDELANAVVEDEDEDYSTVFVSTGGGRGAKACDYSTVFVSTGGGGGGAQGM